MKDVISTILDIAAPKVWREWYLQPMREQWAIDCKSPAKAFWKFSRTKVILEEFIKSPERKADSFIAFSAKFPSMKTGLVKTQLRNIIKTNFLGKTSGKGIIGLCPEFSNLPHLYVRANSHMLDCYKTINLTWLSLSLCFLHSVSHTTSANRLGIWCSS